MLSLRELLLGLSIALSLSSPRQPKSSEGAVSSHRLRDYALKLGKRLRGKLSSQWSLELKPVNSPRHLHWFAGPQRGWRLRFIHSYKKVAVPKVSPPFELFSRRTEVVPWRCSVHLFPRTGTYRAEYSPLIGVKPAKFLGATRRALFFLPNPILSGEFPCPSMVSLLLRAAGISPRFREIELRNKVENIDNLAKIFRFHAEIKLIKLSRTSNSLFEKISKILGRKTLFFVYQKRSFTRFLIYNR